MLHCSTGDRSLSPSIPTGGPHRPTILLERAVRESLVDYTIAANRAERLKVQRERQIAELRQIIEIRTRSLGFAGSILGFARIGEHFYRAYDQLCQLRAEARRLQERDQRIGEEMATAQRRLLQSSLRYLAHSSSILRRSIARASSTIQIEFRCRALASKARAIVSEFGSGGTVRTVGDASPHSPTAQPAARSLSDIRRELKDIRTLCEQLKGVHPDLAPSIRPAIRALSLIEEHLFGSTQNSWGLREGLNPFDGISAGTVVSDALGVASRRTTDTLAKVRSKETQEIASRVNELLQQYGVRELPTWGDEELADAVHKIESETETA